jgi:hypothetical protein
MKLLTTFAAVLVAMTALSLDCAVQAHGIIENPTFPPPKSGFRGLQGDEQNAE